MCMKTYDNKPSIKSLDKWQIMAKKYNTYIMLKLIVEKLNIFKQKKKKKKNHK